MCVEYPANDKVSLFNNFDKGTLFPVWPGKIRYSMLTE